ncbi:MAG: thioesterase family protein [Candidatus Zapsychrus exili]|nr:thioesterase family protein [Candidatus Zapsychrus exili]
MEKKIYYHDTDAGGVVYYGTYLNYLEEDRTDFLEKKGLSIKKMHENSFFYAVKKCSIEYKSPARYGDTIYCETKLIKTTGVKLIFDQKIFNKETKNIILEAEIVLVSLNKDFKPKPIPENLKIQLL